MALEYMVPVGSGLLIQGQYIYAGSGSLFSPYQEPAGEPGAEPEPAHYLMGRLSYNFTLEDSVLLSTAWKMACTFSLGFYLPQGWAQVHFLRTRWRRQRNLSPDQVHLSVEYRF